MTAGTIDTRHYQANTNHTQTRHKQIEQDPDNRTHNRKQQTHSTVRMGQRYTNTTPLITTATPRVQHTNYNDIADNTRYDQQQLELDREWYNKHN